MLKDLPNQRSTTKESEVPTRINLEGPYRIVRHPLYLCEGVALVGVTLQVLSPLAVLIAIVVVMVQCRRMINEEAILKLAFPE